MQPWYKSATKIVLVIITIALVFLTYQKIIEAKDFMMAAMLILGYYFTKSGVKTGQYGATNTSDIAKQVETDEYAAITPVIEDVDDEVDDLG